MQNLKKYTYPAGISSSPLMLFALLVLSLNLQQSNASDIDFRSIRINLAEAIDDLKYGLTHSINHKATASQIFLRQSASTTKSDIDLQFDYFDKFLEGFKATTFAPNVFKCSTKARLTANEYNQTTIANKNNTNQTLDQFIFSYTSIMSTSTADAAGECYTSLYNMYAYI